MSHKASSTHLRSTGRFHSLGHDARKKIRHFIKWLVCSFVGHQFHGLVCHRCNAVADSVKDVH